MKLKSDDKAEEHVDEPAVKAESAEETAEKAAVALEGENQQSVESTDPEDEPEEQKQGEPEESDGELADSEAAAEDEPEQSDNPEDSEAEAAVEFEGDRPLVKELVYQAPRGKQTPEELEEAESLKFSSVAEAKSVVEGFLFSCNEPLSVSKLSKLMNNLHPKSVRGLLLELQWDYENHPGALQIVEIAGGYQMCTRAHVAPWMFRMHKHKRRSALSPATLETLAIVAYRQPITKGEIETIRGVESGAPLRTLQDLNMVEASGRREVIGRPQLYVTTEQFLKAFGLKSVADLPSIAELKSRFAEEQKIKRVVAEEPKAEVSEETAEPELEAADADDNVAVEGDEATADEAIEAAELEDGNGESAHEATDAEELDDELDEIDEVVEGEDDKQKKAQGSFAEEDSLDES